MSDLITTTQLARTLDLAPSTVRHYRSTGKLTPAAQTPGGHARWDLDGVRAQLWPQGRVSGSVTGLKTESFAPPGETRITPGLPSAVLPPEMVALRVREIEEPSGDAAHHRWGGALLRPRGDRAS